MFSPLEEQAALRVSPSVFGPLSVAIDGGGGGGGGGSAVGSWANSTAQQAELVVTFPVPDKATTFGVGVIGMAEAFVEFTPQHSAATTGVSGSWLVRVGVRPPRGGDIDIDPTAAAGQTSDNGTLSRYMAHTDLNGGDYNKAAATGRHLPPGTDPKVCQAECDAAAECVA